MMVAAIRAIAAIENCKLGTPSSLSARAANAATQATHDSVREAKSAKISSNDAVALKRNNARFSRAVARERRRPDVDTPSGAWARRHQPSRAGWGRAPARPGSTEGSRAGRPRFA
jgi:hypothetical protein